MKKNKMSGKRSKQTGIGLVGLFFGAFLTMFFSVMAVSLLPSYMENFSVKSCIASLVNDKKILRKNESTIKKALLKKLSVSNVKNVTAKDISIQKERKKVKIKVDYMVQAKFIKNVNFLVHFDEMKEASL